MAMCHASGRSLGSNRRQLFRRSHSCSFQPYEIFLEWLRLGVEHDLDDATKLLADADQRVVLLDVARRNNHQLREWRIVVVLSINDVFQLFENRNQRIEVVRLVGL